MQTDVILVRKNNFAIFVKMLFCSFSDKSDSMALAEKVIKRSDGKI